MYRFVCSYTRLRCLLKSSRDGPTAVSPQLCLLGCTQVTQPEGSLQSPLGAEGFI